MVWELIDQRVKMRSFSSEVLDSHEDHRKQGKIADTVIAIVVTGRTPGGEQLAPPIYERINIWFLYCWNYLVYLDVFLIVNGFSIKY